MRLLLGLGNPTRTYDRTRHNIGKTFIQLLVERFNLPQHKSAVKYVSYQYKDTVLATSETYMNLSVQALEALQKTYSNVPIANVVLVVDDLDHRPGYVRLKKTGSAEGHKGVLSVMNRYKTKDVMRLQLGIGRPQSRDPEVISEYVLSRMSRQQQALLESSVDKAVALLREEGFL